jgi:2-C-methyl-D-erythritol 4-phosphate cytidylyltransferase
VTVAAVIVAGGVGERFGAPAGKQLAEAAGAPLLSWTLRAFEACGEVDDVVLVTHPDRVALYATEAVEPYALRKVVAVVGGGIRRQDSVAAGLAALPPATSIVAVHDGARPLVTPPTIASAVAALAADETLDGVVVGHPVFDTLKDVTPDLLVATTVDRTRLWVAQTPQVFRRDALVSAFAAAEDEGYTGTDDASLVERAGGRVLMFEGPRDNIKVTVAEDLAAVRAVLDARERSAS